LDKFNAPDWKPRHWAWVDPAKDIKKDEELAADVGLEKPSESEPSVP
jgi:capsid protein